MASKRTVDNGIDEILSVCCCYRHDFIGSFTSTLTELIACSRGKKSFEVSFATALPSGV